MIFHNVFSDVYCDILVEPSGGFLSTDYGRLAGAKRIARCNTDRRFLDGSSMRRLECLNTGLWNDTLDSCECEFISLLYLITAALTILKNLYIMCWIHISPYLLSCVDKFKCKMLPSSDFRCPIPSLDPNADVTYTNATINSTALHTCKTGYYYANSDESQFSTCLYMGPSLMPEWSAVIFCEGMCNLHLILSYCKSIQRNLHVLENLKFAGRKKNSP